MAYTLNDALLTLASYALPIHDGIATGGSTTQLIDTVRIQANDTFNNGVIFFRTGTYANTYAVVTDYASATGIFTFAALTGAGIVAGVQYAVFSLMSGLNLYDMIHALNQALQDCGDVLQEDETLTTVDEQEEYDLPTGVYHVRKVQIAQDTAAPWNWRLCSHWDELGAHLRIPYQYSWIDTGYKIRLTYKAKHAALSVSTSEVSSQINTEWLKFTAAINLIRSLANRGSNWSDYKTIYEEAQQKVITMRPTYGIDVMVKGA